MTTLQVNTPEYSPGLEGVIAGKTAISHVNPERQSLMYRGYDIRDLVEHSNFEEVAYLLIYGQLPNKQEYETFCKQLKQERDIPEQIITAIKLLPPNSNAMDLLRLGAAMLPFYDAETLDNSHEANVRKAIRLVAKFPALITYSFRLNRGQEIIKPNNTLNHSENFLYMLLGKKMDPYLVKVFDATLICYADHGFNASTFSSRVTTSTLSDIYSGIVSAVGTLKGPLHGGANEEAMKMLEEIGSPEKAESWVMNALTTKRKIMGFGHRAYKTGDPRAFILTDWGRQLSEKVGNPKWADIAAIVEDVMRREKNILANVDFPTAYIYYLMDLPTDIYTPVFALSRVAGWSAHVIEQLDNNRLIRPKAIYDGPAHIDYVPLAQR